MSEGTTEVLSVVVTKDAKVAFDKKWKGILDHAKKNGYRKPLKGVYLEQIISGSSITQMDPEEYLKSLK